LLATCQGGGAVTTDVTIEGAIAIICRKDSNLLAKNGGHIALIRDWAQSLLDMIGFVKRKATKFSVNEMDRNNSCLHLPL